MFDAMIDSWWAVVLRGAAALLFGLLALLLPGLTLGGLVTLFAVYALVDGVLALILGQRIGDAGARPFTVEAVASVALGLIALLWSDINAFTLLLFVGLRAIVVGGAELVAALRMHRPAASQWRTAVTAGASTLLGLVLVVLPSMGVLAVLWWIALYALVVGSLLVVLGLRLRATARGHEGDGGMMAAV